jgi:outer membrane protein TolC
MKIHPITSRLLGSALALSALAGAGLRAQDAAQMAVPDQLDLKTAIGFALENNFAIRQARESIKQQDGVVIEVSAQQIPTVTASGTVQGNNESISQTYPQSDRYWSFTVVASQTLYAGGSVRSSVKNSRLTREAAVLQFKSAVNDAILQVRTAFYNVLLAREKIKVQESNIALLEKQLKTTTDRFDAGTVSSFDKLRAEVSLANAKAPLITARNDFRLAVEALRQALGFTTTRPDSLRKIPDFIGTLDYQPAKFDLQSALDAARANRPDLQRLDKLASANEQSVTTARSTYYPNVSVYGGWGLFKGFTNSFDDSAKGWEVGLKSEWNIFDGRATAGRVVQAKSVLEQSRLQFTSAQLSAEVEVRTAFSSFQEAIELADASQKVVAQAEEAVRLANARYDAGTATQLDVLQSQVDLTTARTNQVQAYYTYNVAVASLRKAMGLTDEFVVTN